MKLAKRLAAAVLVIAVAFAFTPLLGTVDAASKKKVTVIKSMKIEFDSNAIYKSLKKNTIKYNKAGLVTGYKDTEGVYTLKYDKKNMLKTLTGKMKDPDYSYTNEYNGLKTLRRVRNGIVTDYTIKAKGNLITDVIETSPGDATAKAKYNKKKHISEITFSSVKQGRKQTWKNKFDKSGNVVRCDEYIDDKAASSTVVHITYGKNKLPSKIQATYISYTRQQAYTAVYTFKYKTIKVPKKYVNIIKEQQWKLLNAPSPNDIPRGTSLIW